MVRREYVSESIQYMVVTYHLQRYHVAVTFQSRPRYLLRQGQACHALHNVCLESLDLQEHRRIRPEPDSYTIRGKPE